MSPDDPDSPVLDPAMLNDWQGDPPTSRSVSCILAISFQSILVMSPRLGMLGYLCFRTADGNGSFSLNAMGCQPSGSHATEAASMPLNVLTYLMMSLSWSFSGSHALCDEFS